MHRLIIFIFASILYGCSGQPKAPERNKIKIGSHFINIDRGSKPSEFDMGFMCFYSSHNLLSDSLIIHYLYDQQHILFLNLDSRQKRMVHLDKSDIKRYDLSNANAYNVNGTLYISNVNGEIYRWQDSVLVLEFNVNKDPYMKKRMLMMTQGLGFTRDFTFLNNHELIFQCTPNIEGWSTMADNYPVFAKLNLKTKKISVYDYSFRKELVTEIRPMMSDIYQTVSGDHLLVSYMFSPVVDVISLKTGKQIGVKTVRSAYQNRDIPFLDEDFTDFEKERFPIETESYGPIVFNPYKKCYYRIFYHSLPERTAQDDFTIQQDKKTSIAIFDKNFRWVGEVKIDDPFVGAITPTKKGFVLNLNEVKTKAKTISIKEYYHD